MGLLDDIVGLLRSALGRAIEDRLPSAFSEVLSHTPLSGLKDQLPGLLEQLRSGGLREQVQSWLRQGTNMHVSPEQLYEALGEDRVRALAERLGLPPDQAMQIISQYLPKAVDQGARRAEQAGERA